jgi:hypothetical protein
MTDKIAETLNMVPVMDGDGLLAPLKDDEGKDVIIYKEREKFDCDFDESKQNVEELIGVGNRAVAELESIAQSSQGARDYEVLAKMIKTVAELNREKLEIKKDAEDTKEDDKPKQITNNLFVGSTAELIKQIEKMKEETK